MTARTFLRLASRTKILVIGDLILDKYLFGTVARISPEAPVPVLAAEREEAKAGGAGNVCLNLASLRCKTVVIGRVGNDEEGSRLDALLAGQGIDSLLIRDGAPTTTKTRVLAGSQQLLRIDREKVTPLSASALHAVENRLEREKGISAIIVSDYGKGMVTPGLIRFLVRYAARRRVLLTVDPKVEHFKRYRGVACLTPNLTEASAGMGRLMPKDERQIACLGNSILRTLRCRYLVITLGKDGMAVFRKPGDVVHLPAARKEVFDVTGAGDTVIAVLTLALACGADILSAARIANLAAGAVVQKVGAAAVTPEELIALEQESRAV